MNRCLTPLRSKREQIEWKEARATNNILWERRRRNRRGGREYIIEGVKIKVPTLYGKNDYEAYLEWEMKMEQVFDCHYYNERK